MMHFLLYDYMIWAQWTKLGIPILPSNLDDSRKLVGTDILKESLVDISTGWKLPSDYQKQYMAC